MLNKINITFSAIEIFFNTRLKNNYTSFVIKTFFNKDLSRYNYY